MIGYDPAKKLQLKENSKDNISIKGLAHKEADNLQQILDDI